ncbi:MAG: enoyl-CoA hydratase [Syntrophales bacterium]|nr:enoyl-CoA hydratase [Syntrophales bacterium]MDD5233297.1 enoyl-CoA hydratase [Syntrophales bacterium]MDD5531185.1 enoyl-CoA hydratase [Syntrophales bacterium]
MEFKDIIFTVRDGVAKITFNKPKTFNSVDLDFSGEIEAAVEECEKNDAIRAVVITGKGKAFCGGGDISYFTKYFDGDRAEPFRQIIKKVNLLIISIRRMAKPVIAQINGAAGGAGISLAAACDLRVCAASAKFRTGYTSIGLVGDGGWTVFIPQLVGFGKAMEIMLLDPFFDAKQALEWGFVNKVVEDSDLERTVDELALKLAKGPTRAFAIAKENMNRGFMGMLERQLELERMGMAEASLTADYVEGVKAFLEKRPAKFTGK